MVVGIVFFVLQTAVLVGFAIRGSTEFSEQELEGLLRAVQHDGTAFSVATLVSGVGSVLLLLVVIKLKRGSLIGEYLALTRPRPSALLMWLGILTVFIALSDALTYVLGRPVVPEFMAEIGATTRPIWLMWLAVVVVAPIAEEVFFRGFLFKGLSSGPIGAIGAIVATAILWALMHPQYDVYGIVTIFFQGLLQGAARMKTRSLAVPVAMHVEANLVATLEAVFLLPVG